MTVSNVGFRHPAGELWRRIRKPFGPARRSGKALLRLLVCGAFCFLPFASGLALPGGLYEVREIKPHVFVWIPDDVIDTDGDPHFSRAGTAGFVVTDEGVVVVNTTNSPFHARELLFEIRRRTDVPIKFVVNTNSSGDQMLGNEVFVDQLAEILSSAQAREEMRQYEQALARQLEDDWRLQERMRGIHLTFPSQTFEARLELHVGGQEIRLQAIQTGSSRADAILYLPQAKVLFLGELFENGYVPRVGSRDLRRWIEFLREVETWDVETYIPGHGAPGGREELVEFRKFLEWLSAEVQARIQKGESLSQVKNELLPFKNRRWHAQELAPEAVGAAYRQLASK